MVVVVIVVAVNVRVSLSGSVAVTVPVTTPVVVLVLTDGVPATGAELEGAMVAVTFTFADPPWPSATVRVKVSESAAVDARAVVRADTVGV